MQRLTSRIDKSVNWITPYGRGKIETRFVFKERKGGYPIAYVSSHSGCRMGCKFCFLTRQNQTSFDHVDRDGYISQMETVLNHWKTLNMSASKINVNFMARGEPLANKHVINNWTYIGCALTSLAFGYNLHPKFNISTILPYTMKDRELTDVLFNYRPHVYYSMYSTSDEFRSRWLPNALPLHIALPKLRRYEMESIDAGVVKPVVFHWALIKGQNDSIEEAYKIADMIKMHKFVGKFNLVQYNPFDDASEESPHNEKIFKIISQTFGESESYIVPRVGKDVAASCGMFID